ncbi:MAG TPA: DUF255 domain-containing protein [Opitutaceae bacterium]
MQKKYLYPLAFAVLLSAGPGTRAAERLRGEPSAFLRAYLDSPVDWMPWGDPAITRAKAEQRPVFLFIGSFTSELAGAMRRQTFANAKNAEWLNRHFVCVIVDRDEHPDVAALYQAYVSNLKQLNGWPLNVWLTPDFEPFEGATYLSPSEDWGAPGFLKLANQANTAWETNPASCRRRAAESAAQLAPPKPAAPPEWNLEKTRSRLGAAAAAWMATLDATQPGFGDLPKSPEPELIRFLLTQPGADHEAALRTLRALGASAVRDPLDGGFFRHASDAAWNIPYQQKTLSDQARISLAFLDGAQGADAKPFGQCVRGALDFALLRMALPDGTFASSVDATGDEFTGYYAWTEAEIDGVLGADSKAFKLAHGVLPGGNVASGDDPSAVFAQKNLLRSLGESDAREASAAARLLAARDRRPPPPRNDRATAGEHGLILSALSRAGSQLSDPTYIVAARRTLGAVRENFISKRDGSLLRLEGSQLPADAQDYAALALGCRDFARAANDPEAAALSSRLLAQLDARFFDAANSIFLGAPAPPGPGFFIRPNAADDPPSAESLSVPAGDAHGRSVAAALSESFEEGSVQAPGDELLALSLYMHY